MAAWLIRLPQEIHLQGHRSQVRFPPCFDSQCAGQYESKHCSRLVIECMRHGLKRQKEDVPVGMLQP